MDTIPFISVSLVLLLSGNLALSEDLEGLGPSSDTLRRYLKTYERLRQRSRLYDEVPYGNTGSEDSPASAGYDRPANLQQFFGVDSEPTGSRWAGPGQPEVAVPNGPYPDPQQEKLDALLSDIYNAQSSQDNKEVGSGFLRTTPLDFQQDQSPGPEKQQQDKKAEQTTAPLRKSTSDVAGHPVHEALTEPESKTQNPLGDVYFVVIVAGCSAAAIFGVIGAGYCFYRFQKNSKAAAEVDYPAYGVTGPNKDQTSPNGDRRLAQSAQMYHYQHQKQQMIAVEKAATARNTSASDIDSEEENEEGDYTVYECPGLAPTGEMEVKNPLFQDDSTPMSPPVIAKDVKKP